MKPHSFLDLLMTAGGGVVLENFPSLTRILCGFLLFPRQLLSLTDSFQLFRRRPHCGGFTICTSLFLVGHRFPLRVICFAGL